MTEQENVRFVGSWVNVGGVLSGQTLENSTGQMHAESQLQCIYGGTVTIHVYVYVLSYMIGSLLEG